MGAAVGAGVAAHVWPTCERAIAVHTLSLVVVGCVDSYSVVRQMVYSAHTAAVVAVAASDSYSVDKQLVAGPVGSCGAVLAPAQPVVHS